MSGSEMISQRKEQRWIKAFGIPLHSWTLETFRTFGDRCGGFIDVDEDTKNKTHLYWACICVNNHTINTPATLDLVVGEWNYEVSILEDHHTKPRPIQEKLSDKSTAGAGSSSVATLTNVQATSHVGRQVSSFNSNISPGVCPAIPANSKGVLGQNLDWEYYKKGPKKKAHFRELNQIKAKTYWKMVGLKPQPKCQQV